MRQTHVPSKTRNAAYSGLENEPQKMSRNIYERTHLWIFICWKFKCTKYAQTVWVNKSKNGIHKNSDGGKQWVAYFLAWSNAGTFEYISLRLSFRLLTNVFLFCFAFSYCKEKKEKKVSGNRHSDEGANVSSPDFFVSLNGQWALTFRSVHIFVHHL